MADDLVDIIATARRVAPDVPADTWARLERAIRMEHGATRVYIARRSKGLHLAAIESMDDDADAERIAEILGLSPRRVRQLRELV